MTLSLAVCQTELPWGDTAASKAADIPLVCQGIQSVGAVGVRMTILWVHLDPKFNRNYQWANLDRAVDAAVAAGLDVLLCLEPRKSGYPDVFGAQVSSGNAAEFGVLCGKVAERYVGKVSKFEIGNEVNSLTFFGAPRSPSKFVPYLREAHDNIRLHQPAATILSPGLMGAVGSGWASLNCVEWAKNFYGSGPHEYFDGFALHPYMTDGNFKPIPVTADALPFQNLEGVWDVMVAEGESDKRIWVTEFGFDDIRFSDMDVAQKFAQQQAIHQTYVDADILHDTVYAFCYRDWERRSASKPDHLKHYGLVTFDYEKKPSWFYFHSLTAGPAEAVEATAAAQGLVPVVDSWVDPSQIKPPTVTGAALALSPSVSRPVAASSSGAVAAVWAPTVGAFTSVQWVSTGAGDVDNVDANTFTLTWTHDVADVNGRALYVGLVVSHQLQWEWQNYDTLTVVSDIGGAFTRKLSTHVGASSQKNGDVHVFELYHPPAGTHTITATVSESAIADLDGAAANSFLYRGVAGMANPKTLRSNVGGGQPDIKVASAVDDLAVVLAGMSVNPAGFTQTQRWEQFITSDGDADYAFWGDAAGASSVLFDWSNTGARFGLAGFSLKKITAPQTALSPPGASASAQGHAPAVQIPGPTPPEATGAAEAHPPTVLKLALPPTAAAAAQAAVPVLGRTGYAVPATAFADTYAPGVAVREITVAAVAAEFENNHTNAGVSFGSYTPEENDLVVLWRTSTFGGVSVSPPSGWVNAIGSGDVESDGHQICCVYHTVTASEAAAGTTTYNCGGLLGGNRNGYTVGVVIRGGNTTTPVDAYGTAVTNSDTTTHVLAGIPGASVSTGSLVLSCVVSDDAGAYSTPSGWTARHLLNDTMAVGLFSRDTSTVGGMTVDATNVTVTGAAEYASITLAIGL